MNPVVSIQKSTIRAFRRPPTIHHGQRAMVSTQDTYYDSQSGLHVPVHKEKEISIYLNVNKEATSTSSFVPAQFYKEDASSDVPEKLEQLVQDGITGLRLP